MHNSHPLYNTEKKKKNFIFFIKVLFYSASFAKVRNRTCRKVKILVQISVSFKKYVETRILLRPKQVTPPQNLDLWAKPSAKSRNMGLRATFSPSAVQVSGWRIADGNSTTVMWIYVSSSERLMLSQLRGPESDRALTWTSLSDFSSLPNLEIQHCRSGGKTGKDMKMVTFVPPSHQATWLYSKKEEITKLAAFYIPTSPLLSTSMAALEALLQ